MICLTERSRLTNQPLTESGAIWCRSSPADWTPHRRPRNRNRRASSHQVAGDLTRTNHVFFMRKPFVFLFFLFFFIFFLFNSSILPLRLSALEMFNEVDAGIHLSIAPTRASRIKLIEFTVTLTWVNPVLLKNLTEIGQQIDPRIPTRHASWESESQKWHTRRRS